MIAIELDENQEPSSPGDHEVDVYLNNGYQQENIDLKEKSEKVSKDGDQASQRNAKNAKTEMLHDEKGKPSLKQKALTFTQAVTLVGLNHATDETSSRARRLIWITWIVFGFGLALYQMQDRVADYRSYKFDTKFEIKNAPRLQFPQVTVCKQNPIIRSKVEEAGLHEVLEDVKKLRYSTSKEDNTTDTKKETIERLVNSTMDWGLILQDLSEPWKDVVEATWGKSSIEPDEIKTDLGYCAAFGTVNSSLISTEAGLRSGLKLLLKGTESDFVPPMGVDQDSISGYRIVIHDPLEVPLPSDAGFTIPFGSAAQIQVSLENITHLGPPYGQCNDDPEYKFVNCIFDHQRKFIADNLGCRLFHTTGDERVCNYAEHMLLRILLEYWDLGNTSSGGDLCLQQCYRRLYRFSATQSTLSKSFFTEILEPLGYSHVNTTWIYIYYPNLVYHDIKSVPSYSFLSLLCDLGGALSLLLGATLLTVYEVGEFIFLIARDYFRYRLRPIE